MSSGGAISGFTPEELSELSEFDAWVDDEQITLEEWIACSALDREIRDTKKKKQDREYYARNREKVLDRNRRYREAHREELLEYQKKYEAEHHAELSLYHQIYRDAHKEQQAAYNRDYYRKNKERVDLKKRYSAEELAEQERLKKLLGE